MADCMEEGRCHCKYKGVENSDSYFSGDYILM